MAGITSEQADAIIQLLTEIRDTTAANAIVSRDVLAELAAPRLERERFASVTSRMLADLAQNEEERARREAEVKAKEEEMSASEPRMFFRAHGLPPNIGKGGP